jgi:plasmid replication initiation protein
MKNLLVRLLKYLTKNEEQEAILQLELQPEVRQESTPETDFEEKKSIVELKNQNKRKAKETTGIKRKKPRGRGVVEFDPRDMMETMEFPFLALSKNRTEPIIYESKDGKTKVQVSAHRKHYVASIYDWDIILLVSSKIQEIINSGLDVPPRTLIIPRNEILRALHKHNGKKEEKDLKSSLARLKLTGIETTIRNEHGRYEGGFGFLDSWGYTEREDIKEIRITLSQWLYDGICRKGSLLKVSQGYFDLTSGLKKFLYRTARKHVGNNDQWEFSAEKIYEKSGSEQEFKKFKYDLKKAVFDNDIPDYFLEWSEEKEKILVRFVNKNKDPKKIAQKIVKNQVNRTVSALKMPTQFKK